ncbi:MAG: DUF1292 domain-containing protein [Lachnospiraceae bacterium]|nr:DUF1292 domain-containing protein [Lachnospiraceae bacterium]
MSENDEVITITLEFEDDEKVVVEPLFIFEVDGKEYVALAPIDEESDDVYLYEYRELDDDEFEFLDIEDDAEFDKVAAEFERIVDEAEAEENK